MLDFGQGTPRVLVVVNPTARKQPLRALDMRATVDREEFFRFQHGDGRLELIERLAAAPALASSPSTCSSSSTRSGRGRREPRPEPPTVPSETRAPVPKTCL
jgi:hypothetical protein